MALPIMLNNQPAAVQTPAYITCEQLSGRCGMSMLELGELVGYSALVPIKTEPLRPESKTADRWVFSAQCLKPLRVACKMRSDFDLDMFTVAILLGSLQRIDELEQTIQTMQSKMHRMVQVGVEPGAELERDDRAQLDLFGKNKSWWN